MFKRGLTSPLLKCLNNQQADYVMRELHEGICGLHTGGRSLATKAMRAGYYWPTFRADGLDFTRRCRRCQEFANVPASPPDNLNSLSSPWPFAMWGMDILGPLPKAQGVVKYLQVVIDYFTKWTKAWPLWENMASEVEKLNWKHLIYRYNLPYVIVTDNGTQFKTYTYENFRTRRGIQHIVISIEHPQTNGHAEIGNRVILRALHTRLDKSKGI